MTIDCYRQLAAILPEAAVLATVIATQGSTPREAGAKMVITATSCFETIGGGAGEAKVIRAAQTVLATGKSQQLEIDLSGAAHRQTEGICGGRMQIWLQRWAGAAAIQRLSEILDRLQMEKSIQLVTPLDGLPYLISSTAKLPSAAEPPVFIETLESPPTLLIVGAGHVGIQLAKVANQIGFEIVIQDDRPEWANVEHYPQAKRILTEPIASVLPQLGSRNLFAALVTRSYEHDRAALTPLLQRHPPCRYIGMIGSRKRVKQVLSEFEAAEITQSVEFIYAPIGLDIGGLTPAEIAVSIAAELILVRRGGTGLPLSRLFSIK